MSLLVELVRQEGDDWSNREITHLNDARAKIAIAPNEPWFLSTYTLHCDYEPHNIKEEEISSLFESETKSGDLFFDFDCKESIERARRDCVGVADYLSSALKVPSSALRIYFSGSKGFHLTLHFACTGLLPRNDLHYLYRRFSRTVATLYAREGTLDTKVYNARRLFRVAGTVHPRTGKRKIRVSLEDLRAGRYDAEYFPQDEPRPLECPLLKEQLLRIELREDERLHSLGRLPKEFLSSPLDCIMDPIVKGVPIGCRNDAAYTIALYWRSLGLSAPEIKDKMMGLVSVSRLEEDELVRTIQSAIKSQHRFGLQDSVLEEFITEKDKSRWKKARLDESYVSLSEVAKEFYEDVTNKKGTTARYFVSSLDDKLGGINGGEMVVLGAATGTGKSEFGFHVAYENALSGTPSAFVTLEVANKDFVGRLLRGKLQLPQAKFWSGNLDPEHLLSLQEQVSSLSAADIPLFFRRKKSFLSIDELEALVSSLVVEQQCRLIVLDHLHYMGGREMYGNENTYISNTIRSINNLCVRYNVAMVVIAHFKKQPDPLHRPTLHEFRDSSAIEQEASTVLIMWRNTQGSPEQQRRTEFIVAKSRKDITLGSVHTLFDPVNRQYLPFSYVHPQQGEKE